MKSPAAAAAVVMLTFLLSLAFFQTCYSLKCYKCMSEGFKTRSCDQIVDTKHLVTCNATDRVCFTGALSGPVVKRAIARDCVSFRTMLEYKRTMDLPAESGVTYESYACNSDGCNDQ